LVYHKFVSCATISSSKPQQKALFLSEIRPQFEKITYTPPRTKGQCRRTCSAFKSFVGASLASLTAKSLETEKGIPGRCSFAFCRWQTRAQANMFVSSHREKKGWLNKMRNMKRRTANGKRRTQTPKVKCQANGDERRRKPQ